MPDLKISALTDATSVADVDELPIVQGGVTKRATRAELLAGMATSASVTSAVSTHAGVTSGVHGISTFMATVLDDIDATAARTTLGAEAAGAVTTHVAAADPHTQYALEQQPVNAQTGTTYTLVLADGSRLVTCDNAGAITVTVPTNATAAIPVGTYVDIMQLGAGQVTVAAAGGVTLRLSGLTSKARAQYSRIGLQKIATDTWSVFGDLAAS